MEHTSKPVILLVEDGEQLRPLLAGYLEQAFSDAYEVKALPNEQHARDWMMRNAGAREVSLLVTDWDMTEKEAGAQVIRDLRIYFPAARVIVATGDPGNERSVKACWPDAIIYKPFISPELIGPARELLAEAVTA